MELPFVPIGINIPLMDEALFEKFIVKITGFGQDACVQGCESGVCGSNFLLAPGLFLCDPFWRRAEW